MIPRRRAWLVGLPLVLAASGCEVRFGRSPAPPATNRSFTSSTERFTWQGKTVEIVRQNSGVSSSSRTQTNDRVELSFDSHRVVLTPNEIVLDGAKKPVKECSKITVRSEGGRVRVEVDGKPFLP
jgi:hypothetical protein